MTNEELRANYENFGFALCGVIGNLYEYLSDKDLSVVPAFVANAYCEATEAMLKEGATTIGCGEKKYNVDDLEELMEEIQRAQT